MYICHNNEREFQLGHYFMKSITQQQMKERLL